MRFSLVFALLAVTSACTDARSERTQRQLDELAHERGYGSYDDMSRDLVQGLKEAAEEERGGETYEEYDKRRDSYGGERGAVGGYGCTQDCSGHEAGYAWAEERGIANPDDCGGNSFSFEEGCRAYAEEQ
jgi:hypothetical protein